MGVNVNYDFSQYRAFFEKMRDAKSDFKKELEEWLEVIGLEFLNEVREQILTKRVIKTSLLLHSFEKGGNGNVWETDFGALKLEVGTNLEYATWANDGHMTFNTSKTNYKKLSDGSLARFVPGHWSGEEFIYEPGAGEGMLLRLQWIEGKHYFDTAIKLFAPQFEKSIEKKLEEWLAQYFEI